MGLLFVVSLLAVLLGEGQSADLLSRRWREPEEAWRICSRCERMLPDTFAFERNPALLGDPVAVDNVCRRLQPYMNCMKANKICVTLGGLNPLPALEFVCSNTDGPASMMRCVEGGGTPGFYGILNLCNPPEDNLFGYSLQDIRLCTTARSFSNCVMRNIASCPEKAKAFARNLSDVLMGEIGCLQ